ncbi:unnamed protein product, partial [Prorocentrum cordatum]
MRIHLAAGGYSHVKKEHVADKLKPPPVRAAPRATPPVEIPKSEKPAESGERPRSEGSGPNDEGGAKEVTDDGMQSPRGAGSATGCEAPAGETEPGRLLQPSGDERGASEGSESSNDVPTAPVGRLREQKPAKTPAQCLALTTAPNWQPTAPQTANELCFESTTLDCPVEDHTWEWFEALAIAGIYVDTYVNDPAKPGVRLDGGGFQRETIILDTLRRSHYPYEVGNTAHGRKTGKQADPSKVAQGRLRTELAERAGWEQDRKDSILVFGAAEVFNGLGLSGVWDVLDEAVGVKNAPKSTSTQWILLLHTGTIISIRPDGSAALQLGTGAVTAAAQAQRLLEQHFGAESTNASRFFAETASNPVRVRPGARSQKALARSRQVGFPSGGAAAALTSARPPGMTAECLGAAEVALRQIEKETAGGSAGALEAAMAGLCLSEELVRQVWVYFGPLLRRASEWGRREAAVHLPAALAAGRRLQRAAQALQGQPGAKPQRQPGKGRLARPLAVASVGGMINFGLGGGADVQGGVLLRERWADIGGPMSGCGANWFFGISCRCPMAEDPATELPGFPLKMHGPRVPEHGAVTLFARDDGADAVLHAPSLPTSWATCWAQVGPTNYWGGFSVHPRKRGANEEMRKALPRTIFAGYDKAAAVAKNRGGAERLAGDLNPSTDTDPSVRSLLTAGDMVESIPLGVATRAAGRRLVLDSTDLDRHPVAWPDPSAGQGCQAPPVELQFEGGVLAWHEALCGCSGDLFRVLHSEVEPWLQCDLRRSASKDSGERALAAAAWARRLGPATTGSGAGLVRMARRQGGGGRSDGASRAEASALRDIAAAVRRREASPECPEAVAAVCAARGALRAARADARRQAQGRAQATTPRAAGKAPRRLASSTPAGLPTIMNDPECPAQLVEPTAVLEGAARCILRRDWPPWAGEWDPEYRGELTREVDSIRTEAVDDLQRWAVMDAHTLEEIQAGLQQIRVGSHCRGWPCASVLCGHPAMAQALLSMMSLALRL